MVENFNQAKRTPHISVDAKVNVATTTKRTTSTTTQTTKGENRLLMTLTLLGENVFRGKISFLFPETLT